MVQRPGGPLLFLLASFVLFFLLDMSTIYICNRQKNITKKNDKYKNLSLKISNGARHQIRTDTFGFLRPVSLPDWSSRAL